LVFKAKNVESNNIPQVTLRLTLAGVGLINNSSFYFIIQIPQFQRIKIIL